MPHNPSTSAASAPSSLGTDAGGRDSDLATVSGGFTVWMVVMAVAATLLGPGCATRRASALRFANQPIVWEVNDSKPLVQEVRNRPFTMTLYRLESVGSSYDEGLRIHGKSRARDINALGEVPNSTWFRNRIGMRSLSVEDIARGPRPDDGPMEAKPWTLVSSKVGGLAPGFIMEDARGVRYILKFDRKGRPDLDTAADVIAQRLLWAFGYHTPADDVVYFGRDDLVLAPDAKVKDLFGNERPMTVEDVDTVLAGIDVGSDSVYRGLTSRFLAGKPIGGYRRDGVRDDDPNDVIPHQHRRSVRGQKVVFAWLGHTDMKQDNTLDMVVDEGGREFVRHHLVDFGNALGVWAIAFPIPWSGFKHSVDTEYGLYSLLSLGIYQRPWELIPDADPRLQGVGWFESELYDPGKFKTNQFYTPFVYTDRFDGFWAAKTMMRLKPEHIRAAVEAAKFRDPRSTEYMVRTLIERQRKTALHWFRKVNPLDGFALQPTKSGPELCFDDLMIEHGFSPGAQTHYEADAVTDAGRSMTWKGRATADPAGRACVGPVRVPSVGDGYVIVRISTHRGSERLRPVQVHIARSPAGALRIIGIGRS